MLKANGYFSLLIFFFALLCLYSGSIAGQGTSTNAGKQNAAIKPENSTYDLSNRPHLEEHQGRYFRWSCPQGWNMSETTNGVTLSSPDKTETASFAILMRSQGQNTPRNFLMWMLRMLPGYSDIKIENEKQLPDQPSGIPGTKWKVSEIKVTCKVYSQPVTGLWTCGINSYYGLYDASITGFQASVSKWEDASHFLPALSRSIKITNPRQVAGNDQIIPAKNNPLDNSALIESWRRKGLSEDRISQARREGTSGYERMKDPTTGQIYDMPLETYNGAAGGYSNPARPHEILVKPEAGE